QGQLAGFFEQAGQTAAVGTERLRAGWAEMLADMLTRLVAWNPNIAVQLMQLRENLIAIRNPLGAVRTDWSGSLQNMQERLAAFRTGAAAALTAIGLAIRSILDPLGTVKSAWSSTLGNMKSVADQMLHPIIRLVDNVVGAWNRLKEALTGIRTAIGES